MNPIKTRLRNWLAGPELKQLAETQAKLAQTTASLQLVKYDRDEMAWSMDPARRAEVHERDARHDEYESWLLAGSGPGMSNPSKDSGPVQLRERWWELELALEDRGWKRQMALAQTEFSRYGLQQIILISRLYFTKNPLVKCGVKTSSNYVFGRGVQVTCDDETANDAIQAFLNDERNVCEIGVQALMEKEESLHTDGNVFWVLFSSPVDGATIIRSIDATEMSEIVTDPNDSAVPWLYRRSWIAKQFDMRDGVTNTKSMNAWYPAVDYEPAEKPAKIGGYPVMWDSPIVHMKVGGLAKWLFGCPDVYAAIDWARAYKQFLEDWATKNRALARFAWSAETKGGQQAVQALQDTLSTTLAVGGRAIEYNPPPATGAAFVSGPGNKLTPYATASAQGDPEQGRRIMLMATAGFNLPETFFSDASTGSLATAQSLDRPTELKFKRRQGHWIETLQKICRYVLRQSNTAPGGKLREARAKLGKNGDLSDIRITVKFPSILEHDIKAMVAAIVQAATLGNTQGTTADTIPREELSMLLLTELGVDDPKPLIDELQKLWDEQDAEPPAPAQTAPAAPEQAKTREALARLQRVCEQLLESRR